MLCHLKVNWVGNSFQVFELSFVFFFASKLIVLSNTLEYASVLTQSVMFDVFISWWHTFQIWCLLCTIIKKGSRAYRTLIVILSVKISIKDDVHVPLLKKYRERIGQHFHKIMTEISFGV